MKKILFAFFPLALLTGCMSQPLTKVIISDIGIDEINRFQYYISANIHLTATETIKEQNVDKKGTASLRETSYRDVIIINKNAMGVLMDSKTDDSGLLVLEICFEEKAADSDKRLTFKQDGPGLEHHFSIVYSDPRKRILSYGGRDYTLETNSGERVFLKIMIDKKRLEEERVRHVNGRKVEN